MNCVKTAGENGVYRLRKCMNCVIIGGVMVCTDKGNVWFVNFGFMICTDKGNIWIVTAGFMICTDKGNIWIVSKLLVKMVCTD